MAFKRLNKELQNIGNQPSPGIRVALEKENDLSIWACEIDGPIDSPYEGGVFKVRIDFPKAYPFKVPKLTMTTKIYHPNIDKNGGDICCLVNKLCHNWGPANRMNTVLDDLRERMAQPLKAGDGSCCGGER